MRDIPLLKPDERHKVIVEFNDTAVDQQGDGLLHSLIEAQVERTPDAIALVFEKEQLTYRELNDRSNRLARFLRRVAFAWIRR